MAKRPKLFTEEDSSSSNTTSSSYDSMSSEETTTRRRRRSEARRNARKKEGSKVISTLTKLKKEIRQQSYHFAENSNEIHKQLEKLTESHNDQNKKLEKLTERHNDLCKLLEHHMKGLIGEDSPPSRSQLNQVQPPRYRLEFTSEVTGKIEKGQIIDINVALVDCNNGRTVENEPLASATVELVVVNADFNQHNNLYNWSREDFESNIKNARQGNSATGCQSAKSIVSNSRFNLVHGVKCHRGSTIFSNSSNEKVRLGVMVVSPTEERVLEGLSNPFFVQGHDRQNRQLTLRENRPNIQSVYDGYQEQNDPMPNVQNQSWTNVTQDGEIRSDDITEGQAQPPFLVNGAILHSEVHTSEGQQGPITQYEGLHTPVMMQPTNHAVGGELALASLGYVRNANIVDDDHVPVNVIGMQFNTSQTARPLHLIWDRPNLEPSKYCWNLHDQLMPLYSCQPNFNKWGLPTMELMSEHFDSLNITPKEVMKTFPKRGVLIEPLEPDDGLDQGTQGKVPNDNDIESVEGQAITEPFAAQDQQHDGNGNAVVLPSWKHWFRRLIQRRQRDPSTRQYIRELFGHEESGSFTTFKFSQLAASTNNFSSRNKIGQGGFGQVYMGILPNMVYVAIKRKHNAYHHELKDIDSFKNEIQFIPKLHHANIIKLLGCCIEGGERILVYEYMPRRSLDYIIEELKAGAFLSWSLWFRIIDGIAQGVVYLHHHSRLRLVHRDLKPRNILLDCDMTPRIADFGIAEVLNSDEEEEKELCEVVGTLGYIDPEYVETGIISIKSDVYAFGVTILEIITAQPAIVYTFDTNTDMKSLVVYAWELWSSGRATELINASLHNEPRISQILRCVQIALLCVQRRAGRPTMSDILMMLKCENMALPIPRAPALYRRWSGATGEWQPDPSETEESTDYRSAKMTSEEDEEISS